MGSVVAAMTLMTEVTMAAYHRIYDSSTHAGSKTAWPSLKTAVSDFRDAAVLCPSSNRLAMLLQYHTEWLYRFGRLIFTIHPKAGSGITPCGGCRGKES